MRRMKEVPSSKQLFANHRPSLRSRGRAWLSAVLMGSALFCARADQVEMDNGDRYSGKIVSLNTDTLILQNDVLGTVPLPRSRVAVMSFGTNALVRPRAVSSGTNAMNRPVAIAGENPLPAVRPASSTNDPTSWASIMRQLGSSSDAMREVQQQYLAGTTPETQAKFNAMLGDLSSGKMSMTDLQKEAKSAADQLRAYKKEMGDQTGMMDEYLSILDSFVAEVDAAQPKTNVVRPGAVRQPGR